MDSVTFRQVLAEALLRGERQYEADELLEPVETTEGFVPAIDYPEEFFDSPLNIAAAAIDASPELQRIEREYDSATMQPSDVSGPSSNA